MKVKIATATVIISLLPFTLLADRTLYVQNPNTRLLIEAKMNAGGPPLTRGESVTQIGEEGMFYKIRAASGAGYTPKLFMSAFPPGETVRFGQAVNRDASVQARARASNFSQTAAARGLSETETMRVRGRLDEFDFDSIEWLEKIQIAESDRKSYETGTISP